jgi:hypothetical protein
MLLPLHLLSGMGLGAVQGAVQGEEEEAGVELPLL